MCCNYKAPIKGLFTSKQKRERKRNRSKNTQKRPKNKWQTSRKTFAFASSFVRCEWALDIALGIYNWHLCILPAQMKPSYNISPNETWIWKQAQSWNIRNCDTLGPVYNEQKDVKETVSYKWVLVVTELFTLQSIILIQRNLPVLTGCSFKQSSL